MRGLNDISNIPATISAAEIRTQAGAMFQRLRKM
jgi:hypothetical protein